MRKLLVITIAIASLLFAIYYVIDSLIPKRPDGGNFDKPVEVKVTTATVSPADITLELPAKVRSTRIAQVRPQISGIILERYFAEGGIVKKGQTLYQIDPKPYFVQLKAYKSKLKTAEVNLKIKENNLRKLQKLHKIDAVSQAQIDEATISHEKATSDLELVKSEIENIEIKLDYTKVRAPIDGKIGKSFLTQGSLVQEMQESPLAIITNLDKVYADISQSSTKIAKIQKALVNNDNITVELTITGNEQGKVVKGILKFSESIIDESTGSISMRAEFDNQDRYLMPGMFAKAKLYLGKKDSLLVDQSCVIINPDGSMNVLVVSQENTAILKKIEVEGEYKSSWIISSGISEGDLIIKEGIQKVRNGSNLIPTLLDEEIINTSKNKIEKNKIRSEAKIDDTKITNTEEVDQLENNRANIHDLIEKNFKHNVSTAEQENNDTDWHQSDIKYREELYQSRLNKFIKNKLSTAKEDTRKDTLIIEGRNIEATPTGPENSPIATANTKIES